MWGGGQRTTMNTVPTYRRGRRYYRPGPNDRGGLAGICSIIFVLLLLIVPPFLLLAVESYRQSMHVALSSAMDSGITPLTSQSRSGDLVHFTTDDVDVTSSDWNMQVHVPGALALRRKTEYCQWQELRREECETCTRTVRAKDGSTQEESYKCNCHTSYDYIKSWRSHLISSALFDQPGAHYNPQRDPMPAVTLGAPEATVRVAPPAPLPTMDGLMGGKDLTAKLDGSILNNGNIRAKWRRINWIPGGVPRKRTNFFARWIPDKTRYEDVRSLRGIQNSPAAVDHNFVYVGQNGGYFFSPYEESTAQKLFRYFVEYAEGSLLDWQLGDLMPSCTAGDIRFYYEVADPDVISVLGEVNVNRRYSGLAANEFVVRPKVMENGVRIGFIHAGSISAEGMLQQEESSSKWKTVIPRIILLLWSAAISRVLGAFIGRDVGQAKIATRIAAASGLWCATLGMMWIWYWGPSIDAIFMIIIAMALSGGVVLRFTPKTRSPPGLHAVWCMIGRWANVPPSWRMEESYEAGDGGKSHVGGTKKTQ